MSQLYALIDTARRDDLYDMVAAAPERACLFAGKLDPVLERAAPHLVRLEPRLALWSAWREHGWGDNWGLLCRSDAPLAAVRRHFRRFLQAKLPGGEVVLFRFYDPRVWRTYLPLCGPDDLRAWFAGISEYLAEAEGGGSGLTYRADGGTLTVGSVGRP